MNKRIEYFEDFKEAYDKNFVELTCDSTLSCIPFKVPNVEYNSVDGERNVPKMMISRAANGSLTLEIGFNIHSKDRAAGLVHILEHCMFRHTVNDGYKLTQKYFSKDRLTVTGYIQKDNIVFEFKYTGNYIKNKMREGILGECIPKDIDEKYITDEMSNLYRAICNVLNAEITEEDFNKEKSIVISEILSRNNGSNIYIVDEVDRYMYPENTVSINHIDNTRNAKYEDILRLRDMLRDSRNISYIHVGCSPSFKLSDAYSIYNTLMEIFTTQHRYHAKAIESVIGSSELTPCRFSVGKVAAPAIKNSKINKNVAKYLSISSHNAFSLTDISSDKNIENIQRDNHMSSVIMIILKDMLHMYFRAIKAKTYSIDCVRNNLIYNGINTTDTSSDHTIDVVSHNITSLDINVDSEREAFDLYNSFIKYFSVDGVVKIPDRVFKDYKKLLLKDWGVGVINADSVNDLYLEVSKYMTCDNVIDSTVELMKYFEPHDIHDTEDILNNILKNATVLFHTIK